MADAFDPKIIDKRVVSRYLKKGLLDEKEYRKHLETLPDLSESAEDVVATFEPSAAPHPRPATSPGAGADGSEE